MSNDIKSYSTFLEGIRKNDLSLVKKSFSEGADIKIISSYYDIAWLLNNGVNKNILEFLIKKGLETKNIVISEDTIKRVIKNDFNTFKLLIDKKIIDTNDEYFFRYDFISDVFFKNNSNSTTTLYEFLKLIFDNGFSIHRSYSNLYLRNSIEKNLYEVIPLLVVRKQITYKDIFDFLEYHEENTSEVLEKIVNSFISGDYNLNFKDSNGDTLIKLVLKLKNKKVFDLLIDKNVEIVTENREMNIFDIVKNGRIDLLKKAILSGKLDINLKNKNDDTLLNIATRYEHVDIVDLLLKNGANYKISNNMGVRPLKYAINADNPEILEIFLKNKVSPNEIVGQDYILSHVLSTNSIQSLDSRLKKIQLLFDYDVDWKTGFHDLFNIGVGKNAIKILEVFLKNGMDINTILSRSFVHSKHENFLEYISFLLQNGADPNFEKRGHTPLSYASRIADSKIRLEAISILLQYGAEINKQNRDGETVLHSATSRGNIRAIKKLLDNGAKNIPNNKGETPFKMAVKSKNKEIIDLFLTAPQIPSEELFENKNVDIFTAIKNNNIEGVKKALEMGVDVNVKDRQGNTALLHTAAMGRTEIFKLLIDNGANINEKNKLGYTALMEAALNGRTEIVQLLIEKGANIHEKNYAGESALFLAVRDQHKEIVKLLLDNGAKNIPNNKGETPFKIAIEKNDKEIIDLFLNANHIPSEELFENLFNEEAAGVGTVVSGVNTTKDVKKGTLKKMLRKMRLIENPAIEILRAEAISNKEIHDISDLFQKHEDISIELDHINKEFSQEEKRKWARLIIKGNQELKIIEDKLKKYMVLGKFNNLRELKAYVDKYKK